MATDFYEQMKKIQNMTEFGKDMQNETDIAKIQSAFEYFSFSKQMEAYAISHLGNTLQKFIEEMHTLVDKMKPESCNTFATGPIQRDISAKSIITRLINKNEFPVHVKVVLNNLSFRGVLPYLCDEFDVSACSTETGSSLSIGDPLINCYSITFIITDKDKKPVNENIYLYAAARSDYSEAPLDNSHLVGSEVFYHTDFICSKSENLNDRFEEDIK